MSDIWLYEHYESAEHKEKRCHCFDPPPKVKITTIELVKRKVLVEKKP